MSDLPAKAGADAAYRRDLAAGRIRLQHCGACSGVVFPPRETCPHCGSAALEVRDSEANGAVYSWTVIRTPNPVGYDYNVALIDLDDGVRMLGRVVCVPADAVHIGMRVRGRAALQGDRTLVVFDVVP